MEIAVKEAGIGLVFKFTHLERMEALADSMVEKLKNGPMKNHVHWRTGGPLLGE